MIASHNHVGAFGAVEVALRLLFRKFAHRLVRVLGEAVVADDVATGAADEQMHQQVLQALAAPFDLLEELLQIRRIDRQVGDIVLVEELDLVVDVLGALVARGGSEQADLLVALGQVVLEDLVFL